MRLERNEVVGVVQDDKDLGAGAAVCHGVSVSAGAGRSRTDTDMAGSSCRPQAALFFYSSLPL